MSSDINADFHCVTTWTYVDARWCGVKFIDFYNEFVRHLSKDNDPIAGAVFHGQDGYSTSLFLEDLLHANVSLAHTLEGQPLSIEYGAPVRLIVPAHYGYKNVKHLTRIEFYSKLLVLKRGLRAFLDHPRARVEKEERGRWVPGWILRYLYRPLIGNTVKNFSAATKKYRADGS